MKVSLNGIISVLFAALFLTLMATCVKLATGVSNETLVFFRNLVSFASVLPFLFHKNFTIRTRRFPLLFFRAAIGLLGIYCYFFAVKNINLTIAVLLQNTVPLFIPIVVFFWLKTKVPLRRFIAVGLGYLGIIFIVRPGAGIQNFATLVGLFGGVCGAFALVSVRQLSKTERTSTILFYNFLFCVLISFFPMLAEWTPVYGMRNWLLIVFVGLFALGYQYFLTRAYSLIPATKAGSLMYIAVVFGGLLDWIVWKSIPTIWVVIGSLLVITGGISAILDTSKAAPRKRRKKP